MHKFRKTSCHFCHQLKPYSNLHLSKALEICCDLCLHDRHGFEYNLLDFIKHIPEHLPHEDYFLTECVQAVTRIRDQISLLEETVLNQIKLFRSTIESVCECVLLKVETYRKKSEEHRHHTTELQEADTLVQVRKILDGLSHPKFQPQKYKFNIAEDIRQILVKVKHCDYSNVTLPKFSRKVETVSVTNISDTIVTGLKVIGNRIVAGTAAGKIYVRSAIVIDKGYEVQGHEWFVRVLEEYKGMLVSASKEIRVWDIYEDKLEMVISFGKQMLLNYRHIVVLDKLNLVVTSYGSRQSFDLQLWDLEEGVLVSSLIGHQGAVKGMVKGKDNEIITFSADNTIRIWSVPTCSMLHIIYHHQKIIHLDFDPRTNTIVLFDSKNELVVYSACYSRRTTALSCTRISKATTALCLKEDSQIVTSRNGRILLYNMLGDKVKQIDIRNIELGNLVVQHDRVWGGTGRGELVCVYLLDKSSLFGEADIVH